MHTTTVRTSRTNVEQPNDGDDKDPNKRRNNGKNNGPGNGRGNHPRKPPNKQPKGVPHKKTNPPTKRAVPLPNTTVVGGSYRLGGTGQKDTYEAAKEREQISSLRRKEEEEKRIIKEYLMYQEEEKKLAEIRRIREYEEKMKKVKNFERKQKQFKPNLPRKPQLYDNEDTEMQEAIALSLQSKTFLETERKNGKKEEEGFISNARLPDEYEDELILNLREEELEAQLKIEKQIELERKRKEMMRRPVDPKVEQDRMLREQQDFEYFAALEADKQKEKEEREKFEKEIKEQEMKVKAENDIKEYRLFKKTSLPQEPEQSAPDATTLMFRLPNGTKLSRRFLLSDKLEVLMDFVESLGVDFPLSQDYEIRADFPKRIFPKNSEKLQLSLKDAGITPKEVLTIVEN